MTTYSHSRLGAFETCPLQYKFNYIDKGSGERDALLLFNNLIAWKKLKIVIQTNPGIQD